MKKSVSPVVAIALIVVVVIVAVFLFHRAASSRRPVPGPTAVNPQTGQPEAREGPGSRARGRMRGGRGARGRGRGGPMGPM